MGRTFVTLMSRIRYQVAASLDGFIAGPNHEIDWIMMDPDVDFTAMLAQYDTFVMGRSTYEESRKMGQPMPGARTFVFSSTLDAREHPDVTIVPALTAAAVDDIREGAKKDIWLFGGGALFRSFLDAGMVDTVEPAVIPVLLGDGIPIIPPGNRVNLKLTKHVLYEKTGTMLLEYTID